MRTDDLIPAIVLIAAAGCSPSSPTDTDRSDKNSSPDQEVIGNASLSNSEGAAVGSATLTRESGRIILALDLAGVSPGSHALHLHEIGNCESPDFKSAGGHLNPFGKSHGKLSGGGKHLGDLPNIDVPDSGQATTTAEFEGSASDVLQYIFDEDGTAVMLHAGPDDYQTDPAGAAGPRIACGVIERSS